MAANAQRRGFKSQMNCLLRFRGAGHQRCAGQYALVVQFDDGAVDSAGQSKVIGVDDKALHLG